MRKRTGESSRGSRRPKPRVYQNTDLSGPVSHRTVRSRLGRGRPRGNRRKVGWRPRLLLRVARMRRNLTQLDVARMVQTTKGHISEFETGKLMPSWGVLNDLGMALGCKTVSELIDPGSRFGQDNPQPDYSSDE